MWSVTIVSSAFKLCQSFLLLPLQVFHRKQTNFISPDVLGYLILLKSKTIRIVEEVFENFTITSLLSAFHEKVRFTSQ